MISASGELTSTNIFGRLRGGPAHEVTVGLSIAAVSNSVTKSNTWTCLLPTTIIEPSSKFKDFKSLVVPNL